MSTSFVAVYTGPVVELESGVLPEIGHYLDILVEHKGLGGVPPVPLTFRVVGAMAEHWASVLKAGMWVSLTGTVCVDGAQAEGTQYTYYLAHSVVPVTVTPAEVS